ncbi:uncharacterized protein ACRADG_003726 [Cochliomyia hominivorax]
MDIITQQRSVSTETNYEKSKENKISEDRKEEMKEKIGRSEKKKSESKKLKKKLTEIEEQNESLAKLINDKNNEILELKKSVNSLNEVINSVPINELRCNSSIASAKLLELSKKNRQLKAELETTKNRLTCKEQHVLKLQKQIQEKEIKEQNKIKNSSDLEEMQIKINNLQQKLFESRNKNIELSTQLKLAQRCLQQEIGENFNLNILANQKSSWRGRAQQILHLQQKLKELQDKLDNPNTKEDHINFSPFERPQVSKSEILHRSKVESLEKEIENLKLESQEQRNKILALKVRNKTLNEEILQYKNKASTLEEKTDFNSINLINLNERLNQQKLDFDKKLKEIVKEKEEVMKENKDLEINKEYMEEKLQELGSLLLDKDQTIDDLNNLIKKLEQDLKAICGGFLFSCRELRKEEFITILDSLEAEKNSLMDLNKTLNDRILQERNKNDTLMDQIAKQKLRISRLESKIRDLEHELELQMEKKRRSLRIAEYSANLSTTSSLSSFTFENSSLMAIGLDNKSLRDHENECDYKDLKNSLELTTEKMIMLREKLDYLKAEKENDIKTFNEIIANTKQILADTILAQRNKSSEIE